MSIFITKWLSGDTTTGKVTDQRKYYAKSNYHICDHLEDHTEHVLQCQSNGICELRDKTILELCMLM